MALYLTVATQIISLGMAFVTLMFSGKRKKAPLLVARLL